MCWQWECSFEGLIRILVFLSKTFEISNKLLHLLDPRISSSMLSSTEKLFLHLVYQERAFYRVFEGQWKWSLSPEIETTLYSFNFLFGCSRHYHYKSECTSVDATDSRPKYSISVIGTARILNLIWSQAIRNKEHRLT